jgi:hypothetical protein
LPPHGKERAALWAAMLPRIRDSKGVGIRKRSIASRTVHAV